MSHGDSATQQPPASPADRRLAGKVAIVTGAGSRADGIGNGRATSVLLARHGARVALLDTVKEWVDATADVIKAGAANSWSSPRM